VRDWSGLNVVAGVVVTEIDVEVVELGVAEGIVEGDIVVDTD